jgi:SPP1 gp7 family putative phage head morphogenesis protein
MNDIALNEVLKSQVKGKFKGSRNLKCKVAVHYKENSGREYARLMWSYIRLVKEVINLYFPEIKSAYMGDKYDITTYHQDDNKSLMKIVENAFAKMGGVLDKRMTSFELERKVKSLAEQARKLSVKEWKKVVNATLGIDIADDYYLGEFYQQQLDTWSADNANLIKSIPHDMLSEMEGIMKDGFNSGRTLTDIVSEIESVYHIGRNKAKFLARDQMAKLNSDLSEYQQRDAGITQYEWSTSQDGRVRDSHRELNGKRFSWDNPPIVDKKTNRRAHPGQDYQCRCVALPVFDIDTLNLPVNGTRSKQ